MEVIVQDANNIVIEVDQGRQGRGVEDVSLITVGADYYLLFTFTDGTTEQVGPIATTVTEVISAEVRNAEAVTILKGQPVYLYQAQGNLATVKLAYNTSDATSAKTLGLAAENIAPNAQGLITCQGTLGGLNTSAYSEGDTLYLGATAGTLTNVKPQAPNHLVYIGVVERANAGAGQIYVRVQNGFELDEIHDVRIVSPVNGNTLIYDASTSLWKNAGITAGSGVSVTNGPASITVGNTGVLSLSGGTTGLTPATATTGAVTLAGTLGIANGGTGQTTANAALNALLPAQTSQSGKYLKTDGSNAAWDQLDISTADITGTLPIANGGTGQSTANAGLNALLPSQISQSGKYLKTDGTNASWDQLDISTADITGTLPVANGGTGVTTSTGTGSVVLSNSPALTTPNLGTPSAVTLTNATGLPLSTGVTGTLATTNGGTGLTSFTSGGVVYASSSSALTTGSALTFDGTVFANNGAFDAKIDVRGASASAGFVRIAGNANTLGTTSFDLIQGSDSSGFVYNRANAPVIFGVNNTEQMRLTSTGLGIGTSSPAVKLDVSGSSAVARVVGTSGSVPQLSLSSAGVVAWSLRSNNDGASDFTIYQDSTQRLKIDSSGNLGIGTSSPGDKLHVYGGAPSAYVQASGSSDAAVRTKTTLADFKFGAGVGSATNCWNVYDITAGAERLRIDSSGNVGIGTSLPGAKLDVNGNVNLISTARLGYLAQTDTSTVAGVTVPNYGIGWGSYTDMGGIGLGLFGYYGILFGTAGTERMRLNSFGNLGLGVTPSATGASQTSLEVGLLAAIVSNPAGNTSTNVAQNAYYDGTNWKYRNTSVSAARYEMTGANSPGSTHAWFVSAGGTAGNAISFTQAMTLDASGNLGVGVTSPNYKLNLIGAQQNLGGGADTVPSLATTLVSGEINGSLNNSTDYGLLRLSAGGRGGTLATKTAIDLQGFGSTDNSQIRLYTAGTERARITSGGNLLVGSTIDSGSKLQVGSSSGSVATPTAIEMDQTYATTAGFDKLKLYLFKGASESYGFGLGAFSDVQYWAGSSSTGIHRWFTSQTERARITGGGDLLVGTTSKVSGTPAGTIAEFRGGLALSAASAVSGAYQELSFSAGIYTKCSIRGYSTGTTDAGELRFFTAPAGDVNAERARITSTGNVVAGGSVALATNATDGFLYVPTCAGTPTGTPTAITGMAPIVVDTTNNKMYFYSGGAWRDAGP